MAKPTVPIPYGFDSAGFRQAIRFAMQMGAPPDPDKRPKFLPKAEGRTYYRNGVEIPTPRTDRDGRPLDPTIEMVETKPEPVTDVDCAIEIVTAESDELPVGNFRPTKAVVTFLDDEYAKVADCREMVYNGDRYVYGYEPELNGLFDVGVHTQVYYAVDDT